MTTVEEIPPLAARPEVARLLAELNVAATRMPLARVRDVVCDWLAGHGQWNGPVPLENIEDWDGGYAQVDTRALDRCATIAHRDRGHPGHLDLCGEELCRALAEAGAD